MTKCHDLKENMIKQLDPRRWEERADASMVREDHAAMSNLSPNGFQREIPYHDIPHDPRRGYGHPLMEGMMISFAEGVKGKR